MMNNLQANSLFVNRVSLYSEPIELSKKEFKKLKSGSWLEIQNSSLNIIAVSGNSIEFKASIYGSEDYIFLNYIEKISKKFNLKSKKSSFIIKIDLNRDVGKSSVVIAKNPIVVTLIKDKKDYAVTKVYLQKSVFIEIKEIL